MPVIQSASLYPTFDLRRLTGLVFVGLGGASALTVCLICRLIPVKFIRSSDLINGHFELIRSYQVYSWSQLMNDQEASISSSVPPPSYSIFLRPMGLGIFRDVRNL